MGRLDPRRVLTPACTLVALLWAISKTLPSLSATSPWLIVLVSFAPLLAQPIFQRRRNAVQLLLALLVLCLFFAVVLPSAPMLVILTAVALLSTVAAVRDSGQSPMAPDICGATLAVAMALWIGMQGVDLVLVQAGIDGARVVLPLLLATVLAILASRYVPTAPLTPDGWTAPWLLVALTVVPAWTFIPARLATSSFGADVVVALLLSAAVAGMALLPAIAPQRLPSVWLIGIALAAIGIQWTSLSLFAATLGILATPFVVRFAALGWRPVAANPTIWANEFSRSGVVTALAAVAGFGVLALTATNLSTSWINVNLTSR